MWLVPVSRLWVQFSVEHNPFTQLYLQEEAGITKAIDPWAGSYVVEYLTHHLAHRAWTLIQEVEELGGMAKAIDSGLPKMKIEEAAARKQARIDAMKDTIVGLNNLQVENDMAFDVLEVDNSEVRRKQIERLNRVKSERNEESTQSALRKIATCAESGEGNLLELAVEAARARASLGEISMAMEKVFGRHKATVNAISGIYSGESQDYDLFKKARLHTDEFEKVEGRRPRIMIAKMGQDGHDRGAKVIATSFADLGFDVDIGPLFQTPGEAAKQAIENDVHIIGISSLAAGHKTLVPDLIAELKKSNREDIIVVAGGVIPKQDYDYLYDSGVTAIFGPGTVISQAARNILEVLINNLKQTD